MLEGQASPASVVGRSRAEPLKLSAYRTNTSTCCKISLGMQVDRRTIKPLSYHGKCFLPSICQATSEFRQHLKEKFGKHQIEAT